MQDCKSIVGYDANSLYLCCAGQEMPCGKEGYFEMSKEKQKDLKEIKDFCEMVMSGEFFGFAQVDIEVPKELKPTFSEFAPLFLLGEVTEDQIPAHMKKYKEDTKRSANNGSRKLLGVTKAKKILLYTPLIKWYLEKGLKVTALYKNLQYEPSRPFQWFTEEVSNARREGDDDKAKKQIGDTFKLKGN